MVMKMGDYDKLMEELLHDETGAGRKAIIVNELKRDFDESKKELDKNTKTVDEAKTLNDALIKANQRLFKQVGHEAYGVNYGDKPKEKSFSESIKLSDIENQMKGY